jgi:hypothetical protein
LSGRICDVAISLHRIELSLGIEAGGFCEWFPRKWVAEEQLSREQCAQGKVTDNDGGPPDRTFEDDPEKYAALSRDALSHDALTPF